MCHDQLRARRRFASVAAGAARYQMPGLSHIEGANPYIPEPIGHSSVGGQLVRLQASRQPRDSAVARHIWQVWWYSACITHLSLITRIGDFRFEVLTVDCRAMDDQGGVPAAGYAPLGIHRVFRAQSWEIRSRIMLYTRQRGQRKSEGAFLGNARSRRLRHLIERCYSRVIRGRPSLTCWTSIP